MKFWKGIKKYEKLLKKRSKRFVQTCETLHRENGWYVARSYQSRIYLLAIESMSENNIKEDDDLVVLAIEQASFAYGERIYYEILGEIEHDKMITNMKEN